MANDLTAFNPEYWSKRMQIIRFKEPVYRAITSMEERSTLNDGDVVHRPFRSKLRNVAYSKGTAITINDVTTTDESLTVNVARVAPFYVDDLDKVQNKWDAANKFADDAGRILELFIDGDVLGEYANADLSIDDGDIGGTSGNAAVISTSNITKLFAAASKKLTRNNVSTAKRFAVITPSVHQILVERLEGKDTALGDSTGMNGNVGKYMGFDLFVSNQVAYTSTWTPADNPSDGDTVTIEGVVFEFKTTPATAGQVDIGGSTAVSIDNLVAAINDAGTAGSTYIQLSDADRATLTGLVATDGTTNMTVVFEGGGEVAASASEAADPWSAEVVHCLFGEKGATDVVIQKEATVVFKDVPDKLGRNVLPWVLYGIKTFDEGDAALVDVQVDASSF